MDNGNKVERILSIYTRLMNGALINKMEEATSFNVNERSIQRDIEDIRAFFECNLDDVGCNQLVYDHVVKGYRIEHVSKINLKNSEMLALCKILLDSRAFTEEEMTDMLDRLVSCCVPQSERKMIHELIRNEEFHYIEPRHKTKFIGTMWEIGQAVREYRYIEIDYYRLKDKSVVTRRVKPVAIMFSEYYFYLTAFIDDKEEARQNFDVLNDSFPTIYRFDRIKKLTVLDEKFHIPYSSRFEEGEFRKRIQFMYGGKLQRINFEYSGLDVDAILDRLPTAKIISENDGVYTITAEVFGKGIDMWLRSQGENIKLL
ncbi:MAG: WYL domain-containing protein [Lachnospiraceae bacterium]|nr:WYL domain-containing protein [Lachnospiraceae bacterium]